MSHLTMTAEQIAARAKRLKTAKSRLSVPIPLLESAKQRHALPGKPSKEKLPTVDYPDMLQKQIALAGYPVPHEEWRFDAVRKWRFDLAWPDLRIAIEVDGAIWSQGRHTRGGGFLKDMEKLNAATLQGWRVLRTTPDGVKTGKALELVEWAFKYLGAK